MKEIKQDKMYCVTEDGEVFSKFTGRFLKKSIASVGYYVVNVRVEGVRKPVYIHRLVAQAYVDNPDNLPHVNHKDGNKLNNNKDNLEWVTPQENVNHANSTGLVRKGDKLPQATLSEEQVRQVCSLFAKGLTTGQIQKAVDFEISRYKLLNIRSRRDWKHISCEYEWKKHQNRRNSRATFNDHPEGE